MHHSRFPAAVPCHAQPILAHNNGTDLLHCLPHSSQTDKSESGGAILVFLPGAPEINRAMRTLMSHAPLINAAGGLQQLRILPLHGSLSAKDQARVFPRWVPYNQQGACVEVLKC